MPVLCAGLCQKQGSCAGIVRVLYGLINYRYSAKSLSILRPEHESNVWPTCGWRIRSMTASSMTAIGHGGAALRPITIMVGVLAIREIIDPDRSSGLHRR